MASTTTCRSLRALSRRISPRCHCAETSRAASISRRSLSTTSTRQDVQYETDNAQRPRWSYTPKAMIAPYPTQPKDPSKAWECNSDPERLDKFYAKFLGRGGDSVLTEEVKWLAITHKSFDQGRRGFNDRLAFLGRRILNLQTIVALLHSETATQTQSPPSPSDDREPFAHPALDGLANLTDASIRDVLTRSRLAQLASQMGMREILRWKPRMPSNLDASGIEAVLTTTLYAIIGAVALQKGGDVANRVARERVLKPLGIA